MATKENITLETRITHVLIKSVVPDITDGLIIYALLNPLTIGQLLKDPTPARRDIAASLDEERADAYITAIIRLIPIETILNLQITSHLLDILSPYFFDFDLVAEVLGKWTLQNVANYRNKAEVRLQADGDYEPEHAKSTIDAIVGLVEDEFSLNMEITPELVAMIPDFPPDYIRVFSRIFAHRTFINVIIGIENTEQAMRDANIPTEHIELITEALVAIGSDERYMPIVD